MYPNNGSDDEDVHAILHACGFIVHIRSRGEKAREIMCETGMCARCCGIEYNHCWCDQFRSLLIYWKRTPRRQIDRLVCCMEPTTRCFYVFPTSPPHFRQPAHHFLKIVFAHRFGRECQIVDASFNGNHSHIVAQFWTITTHMGNIEHNVSPLNLGVTGYRPGRACRMGNENRTADAEAAPQASLG
jgi:hypothetical protein